jgi:hypothetical protein
MWSAQRIPTAVNLCFLDRSRYFFYSSISSIDLTRLSGPRSGPTTTQKNLVAPGLEPGTSVPVARNSEDKIRGISFVIWKPQFTSTIFPIISMTS